MLATVFVPAADGERYEPDGAPIAVVGDAAVMRGDVRIGTVKSATVRDGGLELTIELEDGYELGGQ